MTDARSPSDSPLERAEKLVERMTKVLHDQDVADVSLAVALLTIGVVHQYAETLPIARDLMKSIRKVEDHMMDRAYDFADVSLH